MCVCLAQVAGKNKNYIKKKKPTYSYKIYYINTVIRKSVFEREVGKNPLAKTVSISIWGKFSITKSDANFGPKERTNLSVI